MLYQELIDEVKQLEKVCNEIYVYGAGMHGKEIAGILVSNARNIKGFLVTHIEEQTELMGLPVKLAEDVLKNTNCGVVLGLNNFSREEVVEYLKTIEFDFNRVVDGGIYIEKNRGAKDLQDNLVLEITPVIGCAVNCKYCPQKVLVNSYFRENKQRTRIMALDDFRVFLENVPKECNINFAGMAEPFLHPQCIELLKMACDSGRKVLLYTTLEGATDEDVESLLNLPIHYICLHVADEMGYAHITTSEAYYKRVEKLLNAVKKDGKPFVQSVSAQAKPVARIKELCKGKYEVLVAIHDRCGMIEEEGVLSREKVITDEEIVCAFCGVNLNNHVVLPDGTVLLCNMDYGLKHVIGNLKENTYDEIHNGEEMQRIRRGMAGDQSIELLCRKCICASVRKR